MLDSTPKENKRASWTLVGAWVTLIYITVPVARELRNWIDTEIGSWSFVVFAFGSIAVAVIISVRSLLTRRLPLSAWVWLIGALSLFALYIYELRDIPEEALHVFQYGMLSILVYRAMTHHLRNYNIYIAASLMVGMFGIIDEYIQWFVPDRVFDLRDIRTNFFAGLLAQLTIMGGLRPKIISFAHSSKATSYTCYLAATALFLFAIAFQNTPDRVARYASHFPSLSFLLESGSHMAEYGFLHQDIEVGEFKSRFSLEMLESLDGRRGSEVATILDQYIPADYLEFLGRYSLIKDPYAHEIGVHLYRREAYLNLARSTSKRSSDYFTISYRENQILEKYFASAITMSKKKWEEPTLREVEEMVSYSEKYFSPVSENLITKINVHQALLLFLLGIVFFAVIAQRNRR